MRRRILSVVVILLFALSTSITAAERSREKRGREDSATLRLVRAVKRVVRTLGDIPGPPIPAPVPPCQSGC